MTEREWATRRCPCRTISQLSSTTRRLLGEGFLLPTTPWAEPQPSIQLSKLPMFLFNFRRSEPLQKIGRDSPINCAMETSFRSYVSCSRWDSKWTKEEKKSINLKAGHLIDFPKEIYLFIFKFNFIYFLYSRFLLGIYFLHISVYMSTPFSHSSHHHHHPPPHFPTLVSIHLFSTSVCLFMPCKLVHLQHFSRFHIYALIYDICFSLCDLLHSVWQSLGPSTSLQMTQFCSFLWLSNIPFYIRTTSSLSIHLSMGI